ncbi:MAG: hypothetical protein AAGB15_05165 [Pseudomonadota bacterium]
MARSILRISGACLAMAGLLAGCGLFDDEERIEGERIRIRDARASAVDTALAQAEAIPQAVRNAEWTQTNGRANHASGHLRAPGSLSLAWSADGGSGGESASSITSAPVISGGRVFVLDAEAQVSAFSTQGGSVAWRTSLTPEGEDGDDGFGGGLAIQGDTLALPIPTTS